VHEGDAHEEDGDGREPIDGVAADRRVDEEAQELRVRELKGDAG
jgi:hypothetical protein